MLLLVAALLSGLALCYSSRSVRNEPGASAGGSVDLCSLPADSGSCSRELIRYYYDPVDDDCKRFTYSGCGGNANRFMRRTNCRNRCVKGAEKQPERLTQLTKKPGILDRALFVSKATKLQRAIRTTITTSPPSTVQVKTAAVKRHDVTKATPNIRDCPHCDPLFGICINGDCGCIDGFQKLGKICIDINECEVKTTCPANSRCVNTMGSFRCDCDSGGFSVDGKCIVKKEACGDRFDLRYTEEDCNNGDQELRFYYDQDTGVCRQFFYGGCLGTSKNIFADAQTCETLCADGRKAVLLDSSTGVRYLPTTTASQESNRLSMTEDRGTFSFSPTEATAVHGGGSLVQNRQQEQCLKQFDEVLRLECMDASWVERFYWSSENQECVAFWYDSSCDPRDAEGKNFFETLESCKRICEASSEAPVQRVLTLATERTLAEAKPPEELRIEKPSRIFVPVEESRREEDPFGLLQSVRPGTVAAFSTTSTVRPPVAKHKAEVSNFAAKTPIQPFDRKKYMEEFRKKLTALPNGYRKITSTKNLTRHAEGAGSQPGKETYSEETAIYWPTNSPDVNDVHESVVTCDIDVGKKRKITKLSTQVAEEGSTHGVTGVKPLEDILGTSTFDRKKFAEEFRKKLLALPNGSTKKSGIDFPKSFTSKREPFTLPPLVFAESISTAPADGLLGVSLKRKEGAKENSARLNGEREAERDSKETELKSSTSLPATADAFVEETKKAILQTLEDLRRPKDLCDEPLHPKLEEDCNNENWELKWFFNKQRGACKSFWYGGCDVKARNFFGDIKSCRKTCGHKFAVSEEALKPHYIMSPPSDLHASPASTLPSPTSSYPEDISLFPPELEPTAFMMTQAASESTTGFVRNVDTAPHTYPKETTEESTNVSPTKTTLFINSAMDVCDQGYDPKWDEDCDNDNWIIRAYYEPNKNGCKRIWWGGCMTNNKNLWINLAECQRACAHKMETSITPSGTSDRLREKMTSSVTLSSTVPNLSMSQIAADNPLALASTTQSSTFALVYPRKVVDFAKPLNVTGSSAKPWLTLRVKATLVTRRVIKANSEPPTVFSTVTASSIASTVPNSASTASSTAITSSTTASSAVVTTSSHTNVTRSTRAVALALNDAPEANELVFRSDLNQHLANEKRRLENRADLAYSSLVNHPVTVASECLERFDVNLSKSCNDGKEWMNRYYYDADLRVCRMYWFGGCFSSSKNDFPDQESCQWKCMGVHSAHASKACLDTFDRTYLEDCRHGEFTERYYFKHERKKCETFHWGGCQSSSQNFFTSLGQCKELCESPPRELTQSCLEPFSDSYRNSCSADGRFKEHYYFDLTTSSCRMFWYGNCRGTGQNIYPTLESCQWICERRRNERVPASCSDAFDEKYKDSCRGGEWTQKVYFDHDSGRCTQFWWDGCTSTSQNIFNDMTTCQGVCELPGTEITGQLPDPETKYRCLQPAEVGSCKETYPAYHFDRLTKSCRPFSYSGCGGNDNRFLTLTQCQGLCEPFMHLTDTELDCHMPLDQGHGVNDQKCLENAGFRFYFDRNRGKCSRFWYLGCGGNANNFYTYEVCQRSCSSQMRRLERRPRASSNVCFRPPGDKGNCPGNGNFTVLRWTYTAQLRCVQFTYSGCGGSENRFATQMECEQTCKGRKPSANSAICSYDPDWGSCNQLRYVWFYNQTRGTCDQFLYGGCEGNPNRFETFELCQKTCELSGLDPCMEPLDRGTWCEAMSNRYYFNKRTRQCKGFHYTGCGKSGNNFLSKEECNEKCEKRHPRNADLPPSITTPKAKGKKKAPARISGYSGKKPPEMLSMLKHVMLDGVNRTYYKTDPEWAEYGLCLGYRYNVTGRDTVLHVHFCTDTANSDCITESYTSTNGEEFCNVQQPFLRGTHLYSWYFRIEVKDPPYTLSDPGSGRIQRANETIAAILLLKPNHCHDIC